VNVTACIFDLDGVIVDTAKYHYLAWKRLAQSLGFDLTVQQNELLKGVSRMRSLEIVLGIGGRSCTEEEKLALAEKKNGWYVEYISAMTPTEILPGVLDFVASLKVLGILTAIASASRNTPTILRAVKLQGVFNAVVDGSIARTAKPDPEVFLVAASRLNATAAGCVVFDDAAAGVEAARRAGMRVVGIGRPATLSAADIVVPGFVGWSIVMLQALPEEVQSTGYGGGAV
jgi:beta-phosphoglucomutase